MAHIQSEVQLYIIPIIYTSEFQNIYFKKTVINGKKTGEVRPVRGSLLDCGFKSEKVCQLTASYYALCPYYNACSFGNQTLPHYSTTKLKRNII